MRTAWLITALVALLIVPSALAQESGSLGQALRPPVASPKHQDQVRPPGGVYTCEWIADHPVEAAIAMVSCSPTPPSRPFGFAPLASPETYAHCHRIPTEGNVGHNVFAWSHYEYASYYDINSNSAGYYTWYVQKTDGTVSWSQTYTDLLVHIKILGGNTRRSGAQNLSYFPDNWSTCFDLGP